MKKITAKKMNHAVESINALVPFYCAGAYTEANRVDSGIKVWFVGSSAKEDKLTALAKVLRDKTLTADDVLVGKPVLEDFQKYTILIIPKHSVDMESPLCSKFLDTVLPDEDGRCSLCGNPMNDLGECV